jgi:hypothetical protein
MEKSLVLTKKETGAMYAPVSFIFRAKPDPQDHDGDLVTGRAGSVGSVKI